MQAVRQSILFLLALIITSVSGVAQTTIKVGYVPNLWCFHPTIIAEEEWDREEGLKFALEQYPGPPTMVQAFAAGQIDIMYNNSLSPLPLLEKGAAVRYVAAGIRDDIFLCAKPPLSDLGKQLGPVKAIEEFVRQNKRKVKISTNPKGTASDLVVRYWLMKSFKNPEEFVQMINAGSQDQFQQSIFSPDIDACSVWGELLEVSRQKDPRLALFAKPQDLMPAQPGSVLVVRESWVREKPELVQKLVNLEVRADKLIHADPARVTKHHLKYIGGGLVDAALVERVIRSIPERFISDPRLLMGPTQEIADLMLKLGYLKKPNRMNEVFDAQFYERVVGR